ncbi:MAG: hypothetical protein LUG96_01290 [Tannerellaceae bacterium]|nr:hypothetical protein [Tannerellaceae bacterium]
MTKKSNKIPVYLFILLIIAGCVLACSSIITNDYLKLLIVMVTLGISLFGIMKSLSNPQDKATEETSIDEE